MSDPSSSTGTNNDTSNTPLVFPFKISKSPFPHVNHEVDFFVKCCREGKIDTVRSIIEYWKQVEEQTRDNAENNNESDINLLHTLDENINAFDSFGFSGLMRAASLVSHPVQSVALIQLLLSNGARVNLSNKQGVSALNRAIFYKNKPAIRTLLEHGGDVSSFDRHGRAALDYAYADTEILGIVEEMLLPITLEIKHYVDKDSASIVLQYLRRDFSDILKDGHMSRFVD